MRPIAASAHETITAMGYTQEEARRIRGYLPRHFGSLFPALPRSNVDFWIAYDAVNHYNNFSSCRGKFFVKHGALSFSNMSQIEYRTENMTLSFAESEFLRHFGDILFTDYNQDVGMKVPRYNQDGSLVIKNRAATARLAEIQKEVKEQNSNNDSWGFNNFFSYDVGHLTLPPTGQPDLKFILKILVEGQLANDYVFQGSLRNVACRDFYRVACYLYHMHICEQRGEDYGKSFTNERHTITLNLQNRPQLLTHSLNVDTNAFYIGEDKYLTATGVERKMALPQQFQVMGYSPSSAIPRVTNHGFTSAHASIPPALYKQHSEQEWMDAIKG